MTIFRPIFFYRKTVTPPYISPSSLLVTPSAPPFKGKPKSCFENCLQGLWNYPELYYCEGFAVTNDVDIAASHAWLLNDKSEVVDPTWTGKMFTGCTYFGVVFNTEFVVSFAAKTKRYGILDNDYMNGHQFLREGFPEGALHEKFHPRIA